ncbi:MAG: FtsX-like permease family protein, partial [Acidobacteriota bacterium]|nr:FtsX-like permease family protein [Acidobacteriota bacterium]
GSGLLSEGAAFFGGSAGKAFGQLNASDDADLLSANSSVLTDLSKLGPAGTKFTHDFFLPGTLITFPQAAVQAVAGVKGVRSAVPTLSMEAEHETGTVPTITATVTSPSQTISTLQKVPPLTAAEGSQILHCLTSNPTFLQLLSSGGSGGAQSILSNGSFTTLLEQCLPPSYQQFVSQVVVPAITINQVVNPPSTDTQTSSYSVAGIDPSKPDVGLVTKSQLVSGSWFGSNPADELLVSSAYANSKSIKVGQHMTIDGAGFTVAGLVNPTVTGSTADLYFDLSTLQSLSSSPARVNEVLVGVSSSSQVGAVAKRIRQLLPGAQVLTDSSLDSTVTGSIANAHTLASRFGGAVAVIILLAAFAIAALLTLSSVAKRVREIGTLRALGWSRGRVVRQIVVETLGIGVLGAVLGLALGVGVCAVIGAFGPSLSATSSANALGASAASVLFHSATRSTTQVSIPLSAPIHGATILLGVAFAVVGGLVAGMAGGWRASRLSPATALADLG